MLRFQPDGWLEGLLRPLLLADPVAGLYFEVAAPDWRFACFAILITWCAVTGRTSKMNRAQALGVSGLILALYVWTFAVGNGRYFLWGLVMIGPLLAMALRLAPGTLSLRYTLLGLALSLQALALSNSYVSNAWGILPVRVSPLPMEDSPLRHKPAVFLTISALSFSAVIPRFHPESRWAGIGGQHVVKPGSTDDRRLSALLTSPLDKYLVLPLDRRAADPQGRMRGGIASLTNKTLEELALELAPEGCTFIGSPLSRVSFDQASDGKPPEPGFWFCLVRQRETGRAIAAAARPESRYADVFERIEAACPRFFPHAGSRPVLSDDSVGLFYPSTDVRLMVDHDEQVFFKYFRAMNPTYVGSVAAVRRGEFSLPCSKLPGRYLPPWDRG